MSITDFMNPPSSSRAGAPLARYLRSRRRKLRLALQQAAQRSGLSVRQWMRLEDGTWVPQQPAEMQAIATAIEATSSEISFGALLSLGLSR
jgi:hypothetical protein